MAPALNVFLLVVVPSKIALSIAVMKRKLGAGILTLSGKPSNR
jgi:hypothetical protein